MANTGTVVVRILGDSKGLNTALAESDAKVGGFGKSLGGLSTAAVATGAVIAGSFVAAGVGLFKLGSDFHDAFSQIRVATGATGVQLDSLEGSFKNVLSVRPDSMDAVAKTIGTLNSKLGDTGPQLETVAVSELRLAGITKSDLGETLQATTSAFQNFGVSAADQPAKLDELFRASQLTGVSVNDLATQMGDAGIQLQALGFNFDQAATLVAGLGKAGVDVSDVLPALSKTLAVGAKEGKSAQETYQGLVQAIKKAPNDIEASKIAFDTLGAKAGPKFAALIREGKFSFDTLGDSIVDGTDTIAKAAQDTSTISGKLGVFRNKLEVAFEPLATTLFDAVNNAAAVVLPALGDGLAAVGEKLNLFVHALTSGSVGFGTPIEKFAITIRETVIPAVTKMVDFFKTQVVPILQKIAEWVGNNLTPILVTLGGVLGGLVVASLVSSLIALATALATPVVAIGALVAAIIYAYNNFEGFRNVVDGVASFLANVVAPAIAQFVSYLSEQVAHLADWWREHWAAIQEAVGHVVVAIHDIIDWFVNAVEEVWDAFGDTILTAVRAVWNEISAVIQFVLAEIRGVIDFVLAVINGDWGAAWQAIVDLNVAVWELVKSTIINALDLLVTFIGDELETIVRFFGDLPGRIWGALQSLPGLLVDLGRAALEGMLAGMQSAFGALLSWAYGVPGQIFGAVGDLSSLLWNTGVDLIKGFVGGITSMFDSVKNALGDLTGALTSWKGPPERDAKLLYPSGQLVMQGFMAGIDSQVPALHAQMNGVTSAIDQWNAAIAKNAAKAADFARNAAMPHPPGYVQAEDGGWVPPNYWDHTDSGPPMNRDANGVPSDAWRFFHKTPGYPQPGPGWTMAEDYTWVPPGYWSRGFATGTSDLPQGLSLIDEQGPEAIVRHGNDIAVIPAVGRESLHMGSGGGVTFNGPNYFQGADATEIADELDWLVRSGGLVGAV